MKYLKQLWNFFFPKEKEGVLPKEFKKEWIKRLTNGDYIQTNGLLLRAVELDGKPQMCCLGVACDIVGIPREEIAGIGLPYQIKNIDERNKLPDFLNFKSEDYSTLEGTYEKGAILADMNDNGKSFKEIADYIKKNL